MNDRARVTTKSTRRLPHSEHTSRWCQSGTVISAPWPSRPGLGSTAIEAPDDQPHLGGSGVAQGSSGVSPEIAPVGLVETAVAIEIAGLAGDPSIVGLADATNQDGAATTVHKKCEQQDAACC